MTTTAATTRPRPRAPPPRSRRLRSRRRRTSCRRAAPAKAQERRLRDLALQRPRQGAVAGLLRQPGPAGPPARPRPAEDAGLRLPRDPRHARGEGQPDAAGADLPARPDPDRGRRERRQRRRLTGGGLTRAERVGATVRRAAGPWTDTIHALLRHVRARGVTEIPEPLGRDGSGREVLSFVAGDVYHYPMPDWMWDDAVLV